MTTLFADAISFFAALEQDNTPEFWARERHVYDSSIRPTFLAMLGSVDERLANATGWRVYRPRNDTRFTSGANPYKTFIGAVTERTDGVGAFVQVSALGVLVATGIPMPATDQLSALRAAIADERSGAAFLDAVAAAVQDGCTVHGGRWEPLKRTLRGYPADHPRAEHLRWKGVEVNHRVRRPAWSSVDEAAGTVAGMLTRPALLHAWLAAHVGPSALTPEERFAPRRQPAAMSATTAPRTRTRSSGATPMSRPRLPPLT